MNCISHIRFLPLAFVLLLFAACSTLNTTRQTPPPPPSVIPTKQQVWQLVSMRGRAVGRKAPIVTLILNPEANTLSGQAACNTYSATCAMHPSSDGQVALSVSDVTLSRTICPEGRMNAEGRYIQLLHKADAFIADSLTLSLLQGGKEILKYELQ